MGNLFQQLFGYEHDLNCDCNKCIVKKEAFLKTLEWVLSKKPMEDMALYELIADEIDFFKELTKSV